MEANFLPKSLLLLASEFPPFPGGISTYAGELAGAATAMGIEVTVVAPNLEDDQLVHDGLLPYEVVRYKGKCQGNRRTFAAFCAAKRVLSKRKFGLIHAVDPVFCDILTVMSKFSPVEFLWTVHGSEVLGAFSKFEGRLSRLLGSFHAPARILTNSCFTRDLLIDRFPKLGKSDVRVTMLGVSEFWFQPRKNRGVREKFQVDAKKDIILTAARITPRKGHHLVIDGLSKLPPDLKQAVCYVVTGLVKDDEYATWLKSLADSCGVDVIFTGVVEKEDLLSFYDEASVYCMPGQPDPSFVEGLGLAYLEAAARGLPSIAGAIGGIPEAVVDGETGILIRSFSGDAVASALVDLFGKPDMRAQLSEKARLWAKQFSWESCAQQSYAKDGV